jgi:hypothetical protein
MQAEGVDAYVLAKAPSVLRLYRQICNTLAARPNVTLLRYEDMVSRYDVWLADFLTGLTRACSPGDRPALQAQLEKIHADAYARHRNDFQVDHENVMSHKRQVLPGDHRRKLAPATIERLNAEFCEVLAQLSYAVN